MSVFEKVKHRVPEQESIFCPFCECGYVDAGEHRPFVNCPACEGHAERAMAATREVEAIIDRLDNYSTEDLKGFIYKLGTGLFRTEIRAHLVKHRDVVSR